MSRHTSPCAHGVSGAVGFLKIKLPSVVTSGNRTGGHHRKGRQASVLQTLSLTFGDRREEGGGRREEGGGRREEGGGQR